MDKTRRIAVAAERSSAYGRSFIRGVAEVAEQHPEWNLMLVDPQHIAPLADCEFDGWICRVADGRTAKALVQCKVPVVDCLCAVAEPRFATVKTDAEAIGRLAADHLLKRHFTNFAFCGYRRVAFSDRRNRALAVCMARTQRQERIRTLPPTIVMRGVSVSSTSTRSAIWPAAISPRSAMPSERNWL